MKHRDPSNVSLLDATFFDVRDSLLLETELQAFLKGAFAGGSGANSIERNAKRSATMIDAAHRFSQEIRECPPNIQSNDGFEPPKIKKRRGKQMFETRYKKVVDELQHEIKVVGDPVQENEGKRIYMVKKGMKGTKEYKVQICSILDCDCADFVANGEATNCVHLIFAMLYAMNCSNKDILSKKNMEKEDLDILMSSPIKVPDTIQAAKKKSKKWVEYIKILQKHEKYDTPQKMELQLKNGRSAKCKSCKKLISVGDECLRVFDAVTVAYDATEIAVLRDASFCSDPKCIKNPPPFIHIVMPPSISCTRDVSEKLVSSFARHFSVVRGTF